MKKLLLITMVTVAMTACHTTKFTMGMDVAQFTQQNPGADLVQSREGGWYVYRATTHNNRVNKVMYYYFVHGKLVEVNEGQRTPDIIIDQRIHNQ